MLIPQQVNIRMKIQTTLFAAILLVVALSNQILAQCNSGIPGYQGPIDTSGNPFREYFNSLYNEMQSKLLSFDAINLTFYISVEALCNPPPNLGLELLKTEAFLKDRGYLQEK